MAMSRRVSFGVKWEGLVGWLAGWLVWVLLFFVIPPRDIQDLESGLDLRVENGDVCLVYNGGLALLDFVIHATRCCSDV